MKSTKLKRFLLFSEYSHSFKKYKIARGVFSSHQDLITTVFLLSSIHLIMDMTTKSPCILKIGNYVKLYLLKFLCLKDMELQQ